MIARAEFPDVHELSAFAEKVWEQLLNHIRPIDVEDKMIDQSKNITLLESIAGRAIVYLIFTRHDQTWLPAYLGQSKGKYSRQRIRNHLFHKHIKTGSQLSKVQACANKGQAVGISFVEIDPPYLRHAIEEILIEKHSSSLSWNFQGKTRSGT